MMMPSLSERIAGCLFAGALGDAIGAAYENQQCADFAIPDDLRITDDTQLSLATCESIVANRAVDPELIAKRFVDWFRSRRVTGIGSSTLKALVELEAGGHWAMVGASGERSAGNGAAMRAAPLAFCLNPSDDIQRRMIRDICRITHRNDEAYVGALALIYSIRYDRLDRSLISYLIERLPDSRVRDRLLEIETESLALRELGERHRPTGYVVDSVPVAIVAAIEAVDLLGSIQQIVKFGGDCDTTASMFGNIYGAINGDSVLPMELVQQIDEFELVNQTVSNFVTVATEIVKF